GVLNVTDALIINDPGTRLTIDANTKQAFQVSGSIFSITNLTITDGGTGTVLNTGNDVAMTINNCTFSNNTSPGGTPALSEFGGNFTITNTQFLNNVATNGTGAIFLRTGSATFDRCTFDSNTATGNGGVIEMNFNPGFAISLTIRNSTFSGNS